MALHCSPEVNDVIDYNVYAVNIKLEGYLFVCTYACMYVVRVPPLTYQLRPTSHKKGWVVS